MSELSRQQLRALVAALAQTSGDVRFGKDHLNRTAALLPAFFALATRIPSWPEQAPAGPLDASE